MSVSSGLSHTYSRFDSWFYDKVIAEGSLPSKVQTVFRQIEHLPKGSRVLDIGCGGGQVLEGILQLRPDLQVIGIDNAPAQVEKARARLAGAPGSPQCLQASALELPFADNEFDFVYSLACLKHWPDRKKGLSEAFRVLKTGQPLLLTELDKNSSLSEVRDFMSRWKMPSWLAYVFCIPYHAKVIRPSLSAEDVKSDLLDLGVRIQEESRFPHAPAFVLIARKLGAIEASR